MESTISPPRYVLITPARNEARFLENTIQCVARQTLLPARWIIVDDGSEDDTAGIAARYAAEYDWIELIHRPKGEDRNFAAKAWAFRAGQDRLRTVEYDIIGNLDADVSLDPDHFAFLMNRFAEDPHLGVAGTVFREDGYDSSIDSFEGQNYVSGQCQIFRRECFEAIGGYVPSRIGGIDWIAVTTARMRGWKTRSFRDKSFFHHRVLGTANHGRLGRNYVYGKKDYFLGGHPLWEICRCIYQLSKRPYFIGGIAFFAGYFGSLLRHKPRVVSDDLMRFHRREQITKLKAIVASLLKFKKIDGFGLLPVTPGRAEK